MHYSRPSQEGLRHSRFYEDVQREYLQRLRQQRFRATGPTRLPPRVSHGGFSTPQAPCRLPPRPPTQLYQMPRQAKQQVPDSPQMRPSPKAVFPQHHAAAPKPCRAQAFPQRTAPLAKQYSSPHRTPLKDAFPPNVKHFVAAPPRHSFPGPSPPKTPLKPPQRPSPCGAYLVDVHEFGKIVQGRLETAVAVGIIDSSQYRLLLQLLVPAASCVAPQPAAVQPITHSPMKHTAPLFHPTCDRDNESSCEEEEDEENEDDEDVVLLDAFIAPPSKIPVHKQWDVPTDKPVRPKVPPFIPRLKGDLEKLPR